MSKSYFRLFPILMAMFALTACGESSSGDSSGESSSIDESNLCGVDKHVYNDTCEDDSLQNCGAHNNNCESSVMGWVNGACFNHRCVVSECMSGMKINYNTCVPDANNNHCGENKHPFGDGCEDDNALNCGAHDYKCELAIPGWEDGSCLNGLCIASACTTGMKVNAGKCIVDPAQNNCGKGKHPYNGNCEDDSIHNCGAHGIVCSDSFECNRGGCMPTVGSSYTFGHYEQDNDLENGKEPITWRVIDRDGDKFMLMSESILDAMFFTYTDSQPGNLKTYWANSDVRSWLNGYNQDANLFMHDYTNDNFIQKAFTPTEQSQILVIPYHDDDNKLDTSDKIRLISRSEVDQISKKYNINFKNDIPPYVSPYAANIFLYTITAYTNGEVKKNPVCTSFPCVMTGVFYWHYLDGYQGGTITSITVLPKEDYLKSGIRPVIWLNLEPPYECEKTDHIYNNNCEADSIEHCGSHDNNCETSVMGWKSGSCTEHVCTPAECQPGYKVQNNVCVPDLENNTCGSGKHPNGSDCENDDLQNCGAHEYDCTKLPAWKEGSCNNGVCSISTCMAGFHLYENSCEENTVEHCGEHGNNCEYAYSTAETVICVNGTSLSSQQPGKIIDIANCVVTSCITGLHLDDNTLPKDRQCVGDTFNVCGNDKIDCKSQGVANGMCKQGKCEIRECEKDYHLVDNQCIVSSNACCGSNCSPCASGTYCNNDVCKTKDQLQVGDIVEFGHYEQDNDLKNGPESIQWKILDKKDNQYLLVTKDVLAFIHSHETNIHYENYVFGSESVYDKYPLSYQNSSFRSWLNGYGPAENFVQKDYSNAFILEAFTEEERAKILTTNVDNQKPKMKIEKFKGNENSPDVEWILGNNTQDKLFLLSLDEVDQYMPDLESRTAFASKYYVKKGGRVYSDAQFLEKYSDNSCVYNCYVDWWLRNMAIDDEISLANVYEYLGYANSYVHDVPYFYSPQYWTNKSGRFQTGTHSEHQNAGVRPAMWVEF